MIIWTPHKIFQLLAGAIAFLFWASYTANAQQADQNLSPTDKINLANDNRRMANGCIKLTLPTKIITPGKYCLAADHSVKKSAIIIESDDVRIDLQEHVISGPYNSHADFYGISSFGYKRISVTNGVIRGFTYGVYLSDYVDRFIPKGNPLPGGWHRIENVTVEDSLFRGIRTEGNNNIIQGNIVRNTGGTTQYENAYVFAIENYGQAAVIADNKILGVRGTGTSNIGEGVGISVTARGRGTIIRGNLIANDSIDRDSAYHWPGASRSTYGIWVGGNDGGEVIADGNVIANFVYGVTFRRTMGGLASNNVVTGAIVPIYLPSLNGTWHAKALNNICDIDATELATGRRTFGCVEYIEPKGNATYLPSNSN